MTGRRAKRSWLRDNGLTIVLVALFGVSVIDHAVMGWGAEIAERALHGDGALGVGGEFLGTLFEN
jgi:hypothetical protein